jgi:hypothetical protein
MYLLMAVTIVFGLFFFYFLMSSVFLVIWDHFKNKKIMKENKEYYNKIMRGENGQQKT